MNTGNFWGCLKIIESKATKEAELLVSEKYHKFDTDSVDSKKKLLLGYFEY